MLSGTVAIVGTERLVLDAAVIFAAPKAVAEATVDVLVSRDAVERAGSPLYALALEDEAVAAAVSNYMELKRGPAKLAEPLFFTHTRGIAS